MCVCVCRQMFENVTLNLRDLAIIFYKFQLQKLIRDKISKLELYEDIFADQIRLLVPVVPNKIYVCTKKRYGDRSSVYLCVFFSINERVPLSRSNVSCQSQQISSVTDAV